MKFFYNQYLRHNVPFWILMVSAIFMLITSMFIPPVGVIDGSVIAAVGELMGFGAIWSVLVAIDKGIDTKVKHKDTEITVGKKDE